VKAENAIEPGQPRSFHASVDWRKYRETFCFQKCLIPYENRVGAQEKYSACACVRQLDGKPSNSLSKQLDETDTSHSANMRDRLASDRNCGDRKGHSYTLTRTETDSKKKCENTVRTIIIAGPIDLFPFFFFLDPNSDFYLNLAITSTTPLTCSRSPSLQTHRPR